MYGEFVNISPSFRREFFRTKGADSNPYLIYLLEGAYSLTLQGITRTVLPGTVVFFSPNTEMERHVLEPIRFLYIRFNRKHDGEPWRETKIFSDLSPRGKEDLHRLLFLTETEGDGGLELKTHYFNDLLLCLEPPKRRTAERASAEGLPPNLQRALSFMTEHLCEKLSVGQIAAHCFLSSTSLESLFRSYLGSSVYDRLISMRMEKAMKQLAETPYTVGEIASHCGFDNGFYFCNAFKKRFGMTPSAYRKAKRA